MKPLAALLVAALGVAVLAVILDSPALILLSILGVVGVSLATFLISARTAQEGQYLVPYVAILAGALGPAALAVTAIVIGERGDAPRTGPLRRRAHHECRRGSLCGWHAHGPAPN